MQFVQRTLLHGSHIGHDHGDHGGYTMPVVGIFVILVLGLSGSLIPPLVAVYLPKFDLNNRYGFRFFNGLAAGVVLGVACILDRLSISLSTFSNTICPIRSFNIYYC